MNAAGLQPPATLLSLGVTVSTDDRPSSFKARIGAKRSLCPRCHSQRRPNLVARCDWKPARSLVQAKLFQFLNTQTITDYRELILLTFSQLYNMASRKENHQELLKGLKSTNGLYGFNGNQQRNDSYCHWCWLPLYNSAFKVELNCELAPIFVEYRLYYKTVFGHFYQKTVSALCNLDTRCIKPCFKSQRSTEHWHHRWFLANGPQLVNCLCPLSQIMH